MANDNKHSHNNGIGNESFDGISNLSPSNTLNKSFNGVVNLQQKPVASQPAHSVAATTSHTQVGSSQKTSKE